MILLLVNTSGLNDAIMGKCLCIEEVRYGKYLRAEEVR